MLGAHATSWMGPVWPSSSAMGSQRREPELYPQTCGVGRGGGGLAVRGFDEAAPRTCAVWLLPPTAIIGVSKGLVDHARASTSPTPASNCSCRRSVAWRFHRRNRHGPKARLR